MREVYELAGGNRDVMLFEDFDQAMREAEGYAARRAEILDGNNGNRFIVMEYTRDHVHGPAEYFGVFEQTKRRGLQEHVWYRVCKRLLRERRVQGGYQRPSHDCRDG